MKIKYFHPVDNDQYSIHAKLVKSSFLKHVTERSKKEKSAVVKFSNGNCDSISKTYRSI